MTGRLLFVAMLFAASMAGAAEFEAAAVKIDVAEKVTLVEAVYQVSADETVSFYLRRFPGQDIRFPPDLRGLDETAAAFVLGVGPVEGEVALSYEVRGEESRVPLFVPEVALSGTLEIRLRGAGDDLALHAGFPRFLPTETEELTARLTDLPSFVRLPPRRDLWSVHRGAQIAVVLLVTAATAGWSLWRLRAR